MQSLNLAIIGAKTQIIEAFLEQLDQSELEIEKILLVGQESAGDAIRFRGKNRTIKAQEDVTNWAIYDVVIVATSQTDFIQTVPLLLESGCFIIDATGALTKLSSIPLFVGLDFQIQQEYTKGQIAIVNPLVRQLFLTLTAMLSQDTLSNLKQITLTQLLPVSFFGQNAVSELATQSANLLSGVQASPEVFSAQIAFNILPAPIDNERLNLASLKHQLQRLLNNFNLEVCFHSLVAPIFYGSLQTVSVQSQDQFETFNPSKSNHDLVEFTSFATPVDVANPTNEVTPNIKVSEIALSQNQNEQVLNYVSVADNIRDLGAKSLLEALIAFKNGAFEG